MGLTCRSTYILCVLFSLLQFGIHMLLIFFWLFARLCLRNVYVYKMSHWLFCQSKQRFFYKWFFGYCFFFVLYRNGGVLIRVLAFIVCLFYLFQSTLLHSTEKPIIYMCVCVCIHINFKIYRKRGNTMRVHICNHTYGAWQLGSAYIDLLYSFMMVLPPQSKAIA